MGATLLLLLVPVVLALLMFWGALTSRRSVLVGLVALGAAFFAMLGAWHAWAETRSVGWALGYLSVAGLCGFTAFRHLGRRREDAPPDA